MFAAWQDTPCPVVGMLHVPPLPGAPRFDGATWSRTNVRRRVLEDARRLLRGGVHGLMLENFGDVPFYPGQVPPATVAEMSVLAAEVKQLCGDVPLGVNILRNDGQAALAVAGAAGADFIRVNVLAGVRVADQGFLSGDAHELLRLRQAWHLAQVRIFADVDVKHSASLAPYPLAQEAQDLVQRAGADALIVSGSGTGKATSLEQLREVKQAVGSVPVWVGSGVTPHNIRSLRDAADGVIVGSALEREGRAGNEVEADRVRALLEALAD